MGKAAKAEGRGTPWYVVALVVAMALAVGVVGEVVVHWAVGSRGARSEHVVEGVFLSGLLLALGAVYLRCREVAARERDAYQRLQALENLREDLTSMVVHDLKNPLASAGMAMNLLARTCRVHETLPPEHHRLFDIAQNSIKRADRMVGDILTVAAVEAGESKLELAETDLEALTREAVEEVKARAVEKGVELHAEGDGPLLARVDAAQVRRVLDNLLENALKFVPESGEIEVSAAGHDGEAEIIVRDTGPGIPAELQTGIFDKFAQVRSGDGRRGMSVGIGLHFAKVVVEGHGGRIWVESTPGQGSAFHFALPRTGEE